MKIEAVSDSSQTEQNCTLFITSFFPITFTRMEPYISNNNNNTRRRNRRGRRMRGNS
jgi:hypothetical protein